MVWRRGAMIGAGLLGSWLVPTAASAERVVFINTDPVVLNNSNGQDPALDSFSATGFMPGPVTGWPGLTDEQEAMLLFWLKEGSLPFDITYTFERPVMGTYDMVVMGTNTDAMALFPGLGCSAAVGLSDCDDATAENVSFLFYGCMSAGDQMDMHRVAFRIFTALGFGWGLENLTGTGQIMAGYSLSSLQFGNSCTAISGTEGCMGHIGCPAGQQNSTEDLNARIGPRVDDGPPFVTITSPMDGEAVGTDIDVTAAVGDLFGGLTVELVIVEAMQAAVDDTPPYSWSLTSIPAGVWTLRVNATDADGNLTSDEISICVDDPESCPDPSDSTGADGTTGPEFTTDVFEDTTTGSSTGTPSGSTTNTNQTTAIPNPTAPFGDDPQSGCQCRANGPPRGGLPTVLGVLLVLGAITRRE